MTVVLVGNKPEKDPPNDHYCLDSNHCARLKIPKKQQERINWNFTPLAHFLRSNIDCCV